MNIRDTHQLLVVVVIALVATANGAELNDEGDLSTSYLRADGSEYSVEDSNPDPFKYWECRRNPTWKTGGVDYEECQRLTMWDGYNPRHKWVFNTSYFKHDEEKKLETCLHDKFADAVETAKFVSCTLNNTDAHGCEMRELSVGSEYKHDKDGELAIMSDVFTEQEAFGLEALSDCVKDLLGHDRMFFQEREFGTGTKNKGLYKHGGNYVTFLSGLMQTYLPGNAAAIYNAITMAHSRLGWEEVEDLPPPKDLGVRTAEFLEYRTNGRLGLHIDGGSHYSISVALDQPRSYEGGYFRLKTLLGLFKAPRLSAIVFRSMTIHGITPIETGDRKVFVLELWDNDDIPAGHGRSDPDVFDDFKKRNGGSTIA